MLYEVITVLEEEDAPVPAADQLLRRHFADFEVVDADIGDLRRRQVLLQHHHRALRLEQRLDEFRSQHLV